MLPSVEMLPKRLVVSEEILSNPLVIFSNALPFKQGGKRPSSDKFVLGLFWMSKVIIIELINCFIGNTLIRNRPF